ncbi:MAG: ABC transporter substrate-binding protein [Proteobacteria bacterium]|nr:ABC transporter substrate-binding protein [Pseudomonadota bacterium]
MQRTAKTIGFIIFLIALTAGINLPIQARASTGKYDGWAWTKKNLNPTWMEWGEKYWPTKPVRGGVYRIASSVYIGLMNPNHWPVMDWDSINLFYEGITAYDGQYNQRSGWLIESFEFTSPTTVIMKLQQGVKFHDGSDYNAKSLKYLFDWIGDKKNGCWTRGQQARIKSLEVMDEYTLLWTTKKPWGSFPQGFFGYQISAKALKGDIALREAKAVQRRLRTAQKKYDKTLKKAEKTAGQTGKAAKKAAKKLEKAKKQLAKARNLAQRLAEKTRGMKSTDVHPVGTGWFMFEKASPGNYLQLKRNPNWWFGQSIGRPEMPYFEGVKVVTIPDGSIQLANLRAGKIDSMTLSKAQYRFVKNDPKINVVTYPSNTTSTLNFNQKGSPCADLRVRKAISHAIDRKALLAGVRFGMARVASCMYPGDHWAHNPDLKPVSYDPELSKRLLAEAGYADGLTLRGITYNSESAVTLGTAVKNMLAKVGIDWQVEVLDAAANSDRSKNLEYDLAVSALPHIQDPDSHVTWFYHPQGGSFHYGRNHNPRLIDLIESGRWETDMKKRQQIYFAIEEELYDQYMDIWLFWENGVRAFRKEVQGWNNDMWIENRSLYTNSHPLWFKDGHP